MNIAAVTMADESDEILLKSLVWLQKKQESLKAGFSVEFNGEEYSFFPTYIERYSCCSKYYLKSFGNMCGSITI